MSCTVRGRREQFEGDKAAFAAGAVAWPVGRTHEASSGVERLGKQADVALVEALRGTGATAPVVALRAAVRLSHAQASVE